MSSTKILNLDADTGKDIIFNESTVGLTLTNEGSGASLKVDKLSADTAFTPSILAANATVGVMKLNTSSVASGPVMAFGGNALVSCATIKFITGGAAGTMAMRIVVSDGTFRWIPVLPDAAITGIAL